MTRLDRLLFWLHRRLTRYLMRRGYLPIPLLPSMSTVGRVKGAPPSAPAEMIVAPVPDPAAVPKTPSVSAREIAAAPLDPPKTPHRFVVWSRGDVALSTDSGADASAAWDKVTKRAGVHRFFDRAAAVPLRAEKIIAPTAPQ